MSYDEAMTVTVTWAEARREVEKHGHTFTEFTADHGERPEYPGALVLAWLGY